MSFQNTRTSSQTPECVLGTSSGRYSSLWARQKCAGVDCDQPEFPVLTVQADGACVCRAHPCWHTPEGQHLTCDRTAEGGYPVLRYAHAEDGSLICECYSQVFGGADPDVKIEL